MIIWSLLSVPGKYNDAVGNSKFEFLRISTDLAQAADIQHKQVSIINWPDHQVSRSSSDKIINWPDYHMTRSPISTPFTFLDNFVSKSFTYIAKKKKKKYISNGKGDRHSPCFTPNQSGHIYALWSGFLLCTNLPVEALSSHGTLIMCGVRPPWSMVDNNNHLKVQFRWVLCGVWHLH